MSLMASFMKLLKTEELMSFFPWDIREEFGKGRVKVYAQFDGLPYEGFIVNMGLRDETGNVCYLIGLIKAIRKQLNKGDGDHVHVIIRERKQEKP